MRVYKGLGMDAVVIACNSEWTLLGADFLNRPSPPSRSPEKRGTLARYARQTCCGSSEIPRPDAHPRGASKFTTPTAFATVTVPLTATAYDDCCCFRCREARVVPNHMTLLRCQCCVPTTSDGQELSTRLLASSRTFYAACCITASLVS